MLSKNGLQTTHGCLDCHLKIVSDVNVGVLDSIDWGVLRFLEVFQNRGRPSEYSKVGMLKALVYKELCGIRSVRGLVRLLEVDKYKLKIFGLCRMPDHSLFSKYKRELSMHIDRIITILTSMARSEDHGFMRL